MVHPMFDIAQSFISQDAPELKSDNCLAVFVEDKGQRLSIMSHLPPEPPSPCQQKSIKNQVIEVLEINEVVWQKSLPSDHIMNGQDISIGQARKLAIALLIILTNLVPVCQPTVLSRTC